MVGRLVAQSLEALVGQMERRTRKREADRAEKEKPKGQPVELRIHGQVGWNQSATCRRDKSFVGGNTAGVISQTRLYQRSRLESLMDRLIYG